MTPEYRGDVAGFARRFFRRLFSILSDGAALVLDNCQEVDARHEFRRIVAAEVQEVPAGMTLAVLSRRNPPALCWRTRLGHATAQRPIRR